MLHICLPNWWFLFIYLIFTSYSSALLMPQTCLPYFILHICLPYSSFMLHICLPYFHPYLCFLFLIHAFYFSVAFMNPIFLSMLPCLSYLLFLMDNLICGSFLLALFLLPIFLAYLCFLFVCLIYGSYLFVLFMLHIVYLIHAFYLSSLFMLPIFLHSLCFFLPYICLASYLSALFMVPIYLPYSFYLIYTYHLSVLFIYTYHLSVLFIYTYYLSVLFKFQLARWSHEVVLYPERTSHPPSHRPYG